MVGFFVSLAVIYAVIALIGAGIAGYVASERGRDSASWFLLALIVSPIVSILALLALPQTERKVSQSSEIAQAAGSEPCPGTWRRAMTGFGFIYGINTADCPVCGAQARIEGDGRKWHMGEHRRGESGISIEEARASWPESPAAG